jgi:hypothetical protein
VNNGSDCRYHTITGAFERLNSLSFERTRNHLGPALTGHPTRRYEAIGGSDYHSHT